MNNNLEVISLTKKDLREALLLNTYWNDAIEPPFSKNKAKWMLENNRAEDDDVMATLAYENQELMAFICLVPDWVKTKGMGVKKIFWSQRWWVADKYKTTILSSYTKNASLIAVNNQVFVKFFGVDTEDYYKKQPYTKTSKRNRYIILYNLDYDLLVLKKPGIIRFATIMKFLDQFSFKIISVLNSTLSKRRVKCFTTNLITSLDNRTWNFIQTHCANDFVPKTKEYVNWQISNDQYHNSQSTDEENRQKCLLGSMSVGVRNLNFTVLKDKDIIGFVSANLRDMKFVIRYFLADEENYSSCVDALMEHFIKSKCKALQTENLTLAECIKKRYVNLYSNSRVLFSLFHNEVKGNFENITLNDQDGYFY